MARAISRPSEYPSSVITLVAAVASCTFVVLVFVLGYLASIECGAPMAQYVDVRAGMTWEERVEYNRSQLSADDWSRLNAMGFTEPVAVIHVDMEAQKPPGN